MLFADIGLSKRFCAARVSQMTFSSVSLRVGVIFGLLTTAATAQGPQPVADAPRVVEQIQRADYEGDRARLGQLYATLRPVSADGTVLARIHYWRGFAMWRRGMNAFNDSAPSDQIGRDFTLAIAEFERSSQLDGSFVDSNVGLISSLQALAFLNVDNPSVTQKLIPRFVELLKVSVAAAPLNPRLLWVLGASQWYAAPGLSAAEVAERQATAMATYERALALARAQPRTPASPLEPTWGEAEILMNLAWSNLNRTRPDVVAAQQFATQALALVPHWHYVRDILMLQIREAQSPTERIQPPPEARVRILQVSGGSALLRNVTGDYSQHPAVFAELFRVRDRQYLPVGDCFGIYPIDPDTVESSGSLAWQIGVRVVSKDSARLAKPPAPYRIAQLPDVEAAVLETTVQNAAVDGLSILRWLPEHGYVQSGPTRMEYLTHEGSPMLIPARIIVPIKKRKTGLVLPPTR